MNDNLSTKAVVIRSNVEAKSNYRDYVDLLRFDFWYACAYCTLCESEALGIGFEVDHYIPRKHHQDLINDYSNLMWSCRHCNRHKSDFFPNTEQISKGHVILRPDKDDPSEHLEIDNYNLKGKSQTGEFNIDKLNLNRLPLQRLRELRNRFYKASDYIAFGVQHLASIKLDLIRNPDQRLLLSDIKRKIADKSDDISEYADKLIRDFARSPLLGLDPEKKERSKRRREYLRSQEVIDSGLNIIKTSKKKSK